MKIRLDPLDRPFSEMIRKRSKGYCERCGRFYGYDGWKKLQCSHYIGRSKRSTRWDEDNACALCFGCHQYFTSHPYEHTEWFKKRIGQEKFDSLMGRVRVISKPDRELIGLYLLEKIKELEE